MFQGAYSPEKGEKFVAEKSPSFTFGAKVKSDRHDNMPGKSKIKKNKLLVLISYIDANIFKNFFNNNCLSE